MISFINNIRQYPQELHKKETGLKMAEELQSLLEKIQNDGIKKAEAERDEIIAQAQAEAAKIIKEAEEKAKALRDSAEADASSAVQRAENSIRQAARDIILKLKAELENRLRLAISSSSKSAMTPEFMAELIRDLAKEFAADPDAEITILSSARDAEALASAVKDTLGSSYKNAPKVFADSAVKGGMQISFNNDEVFFDFSVEAITGLVGKYAGEKLARILENR
jgi:V/A-type H+-transporting ATPase subunit E